ncbi:MAG: hypothetical protein ACLQVX_14015 [Limisphaerales bacterium]
MQIPSRTGHSNEAAAGRLLIASAALAVVIACPQALSQGIAYTDRTAFMAACQKLPGVKQDMSFEPYLYESPSGQEGYYMHSLTVSNVTFEGDIFVGQNSFTIAGEASLCNFDMQEPLAIHFQNAASAFGGDFSSMLWP